MTSCMYNLFGGKQTPDHQLGSSQQIRSKARTLRFKKGVIYWSLLFSLLIHSLSPPSTLRLIHTKYTGLNVLFLLFFTNGNFYTFHNLYHTHHPLHHHHFSHRRLHRLHHPHHVQSSHLHMTLTIGINPQHLPLIP